MRAPCMALVALALGACSPSPAAVQAPDRAVLDVPLDDPPAVFDATRDTATDAAEDIVRDAARDTATDLARDSGIDVPHDVFSDLARDVSTDATPDVGSDVATDGGVCPPDMVRLPGFCMDRFEAPNIAGTPPLAMQNALSGVAWCAAHGKRLCTESEWIRACQGSSRRPYPYGVSYVRGRCTDDRVWRSPNWTVLGSWPSTAAMTEAMRLYQADPSGARDGCVSEEGVQDLTGNVAEWVVRTLPNANNYDHVMKGCYWAGCYGGTSPNCSFVNPAHPSGFRTYEAGFRCCLTPP